MKEIFRIDNSYHGLGQIIFAWDPSSSYIATCGSNRRVNIFTRNGENIYEFALNGASSNIQVEWDHEGEYLAVLQRGCNEICLWNQHNRKLTTLKSQFNDPTVLMWSKSGPHLAIGTSRGNLLIYNKKTMKKIAVQGKHSKAITCGAWSSTNKLVLGSKDSTISLSNSDGDTLYQPNIPGDPFQVDITSLKRDDEADTLNTMSVNIFGKSLYLYDVEHLESGSEKKKEPYQLNFQAKYGNIVKYKWFGDGYILVSFSHGYVVCISSHDREIGGEVNSIKVHSDTLDDFVYSATLNRFATCGNDGLCMVDMSNWEMHGQKVLTNDKDGRFLRLAWSPDGQILTACTTRGKIISFIASLPILSAAFYPIIGRLSSFKSLCLHDINDTSNSPATIEFNVDIEPRFLSIGPQHVAVGLNNRAYIYSLKTCTKVYELECFSSIKKIVLNHEYVFVQWSDKARLDIIEPLQQSNQPQQYLVAENDICITDIALVHDFYVYSTTNGYLRQFALDQLNKPVEEYKHECNIKEIYPNNLGTRLCIIDEKCRGYIFSPVDGHIIQMEQFPTAAESVWWDSVDSSIIAVVDRAKDYVSSYVYRSKTVYGPSVKLIGRKRLSPQFHPVCLIDGKLHGQSQGNEFTSIILASHDALELEGRQKRTLPRLRQKFHQLQKLGRYQAAWDICKDIQMNETSIKTTLSKDALISYEIDLTKEIMRDMGDVAMVKELERLNSVEDLSILGGHIALLLKDYDTAQQLFIQCGAFDLALNLCRDLRKWEQCVELATQYFPNLLNEVCSEYAHELEFQGQYQKAREFYVRINSMAGVARTNLRLGEIQSGCDIAIKSNDEVLIRECANILENMKQYGEAADLYKRIGINEKAASLLIKIRDFRSVGPLMKHITAPKLLSTYAQAKEKEGLYQEACDIYEKCQNWVSVVRLCLSSLGNPSKAFEIVRQTKSHEGAALIVGYCQNLGIFEGAVEFMLMTGRQEEAYNLAVEKNQMNIYAHSLGDDASLSQYLQVAKYFEDAGNFGEAGQYYKKADHFEEAVRMFLLSGNECIEDCIEIVKLTRGRPEMKRIVPLIHSSLLMDRDPKYQYQLFVAIGDWIRAADAAILIAKQEAINGKFKKAHDIVFTAYNDLRTQKMKVPEELRRYLLLLHSYILAKVYNRNKDGIGAAKMLNRVCNNLSKFPGYEVPILSSAVIACMRVGFKKDGFEHASTLMQKKELRDQVDVKYRKKFERIARAGLPDSDEHSIHEEFGSCVYCEFRIPIWSLECPNCRIGDLPYCVMTGRHMEIDKWSECDSCHFPVLAIESLKNKQCHMCSKSCGKLRKWTHEEVQKLLGSFHDSSSSANFNQEQDDDDDDDSNNDDDDDYFSSNQ